MNWDTFISILKWVALMFAAGLIGYFGKYLGQRIIARFSKASPPSSETEKQDYKLEKKRLKLDKKRLKKQKKS